jgi:hypothetical protein
MLLVASSTFWPSLRMPKCRVDARRLARQLCSADGSVNVTLFCFVRRRSKPSPTKPATNSGTAAEAAISAEPALVTLVYLDRWGVCGRRDQKRCHGQRHDQKDFFHRTTLDEGRCALSKLTF